MAIKMPTLDQIKPGARHLIFVIHGQEHRFEPIACNAHDPELPELEVGVEEPGTGYDPSCWACVETAKATLEHIEQVVQSARRAEPESALWAEAFPASVHGHMARLREHGEFKKTGS